MTFNRINNITQKQDGTPYYKVTLHNKWVTYLRQREQCTPLLSEAKATVITSFILGFTSPLFPSFLHCMVGIQGVVVSIVESKTVIVPPYG